MKVQSNEESSTSMVRKLFIVILAMLAIGMVILVLVKALLIKSSYKPLGQSKTSSIPITTNSTTLPAAPVNLLKIANEPFKELGLRTLTKIPDDIFAPKGAIKRFAMSRSIPGGTVDIVSYFASIAPDEVQDFYKTTLIKRGYRLVQQRKGMRNGTISLTFIPNNRTGKGDALQRYYIVEIKGDNKNIKITIIVSRPKGR